MNADDIARDKAAIACATPHHARDPYVHDLYDIAKRALDELDRRMGPGSVRFDEVVNCVLPDRVHFVRASSLYPDRDKPRWSHGAAHLHRGIEAARREARQVVAVCDDVEILAADVSWFEVEHLNREEQRRRAWAMVEKGDPS